MEFGTLNQLLAGAVAKYKKEDALRFKKDGTWHSISSEEWLLRARHIALGLHELGIAHGDHVALLSGNRAEWFLVDSALQILGAVNVPLYANLMPSHPHQHGRDCCPHTRQAPPTHSNPRWS